MLAKARGAGLKRQRSERDRDAGTGERRGNLWEWDGRDRAIGEDNIREWGLAGFALRPEPRKRVGRKIAEIMPAPLGRIREQGETAGPSRDFMPICADPRAINKRGAKILSFWEGT